MKAIVVHEYGGPEELKFEEYPDSVPGWGEVLVRVAAASVNPIGYKRRAGLTKYFYPIHFPGLIGVDKSGTVVSWQVWPHRVRCRHAAALGFNRYDSRFEYGLHY
jgi:NADPH:quinone reductase-like Zn-dependent oxidoreductase